MVSDRWLLPQKNTEGLHAVSVRGYRQMSRNYQQQALSSWKISLETATNIRINSFISVALFLNQKKVEERWSGYLPRRPGNG